VPVVGALVGTAFGGVVGVTAVGAGGTVVVPANSVAGSASVSLLAASSGAVAGTPVSLVGVTAPAHSHIPSALMLHCQGSAASTAEEIASNGTMESSRMSVRVTTAGNSGRRWTGELQ
jgi:hypothetical protein